MSLKRSWTALLLPLLLSPVPGWATESAVKQAADEDDALVGKPAPPSSGSAPLLPTPAAPGRRWGYVLRLEATTLALLPRHGAGETAGFVQLEPTLVLDGGEKLGLSVGAPVRLRAWGGEKAASIVRKEDWDTLSDWGQWVRFLTLGNESSPVALWAGSLDIYSLLSGHLVRHYSNRANPDYHPAGAVLTGTLGPFYAEAFTSDVLGARLMGAEVEVDVEHVLSGRPPQPGRYTLALSAVHDWGRAGGTARPVTLAHLDSTAVVLVRRDKDLGFEAQVFAGWGGRPGVGGAWGAVAGVGADVVSPTLDLLARLEARRQHGGFRQGYFGPDYELARFQVAGASAPSLADASFPEGYSAYGELVVGWDAVHRVAEVRRHLHLVLAVEAFSSGRVDADGRFAVQLLNRNLGVALRGVAVGLRQPGTRYLTSGEVRWRLFGGALYVVGQGGTLLYPTVDGTLRPGAFASFGMGADNAR
ncbi:hypothetical protein [Pyxidicoccus trucidator]|uniref:hypothetical protein n=1 Tax=Pyxidicoccus trucidator TaxID=2709662 RepID=UPI0013DD33D9|nr:hypothetical protein [Pyxidicoccus trucidator]